MWDFVIFNISLKRRADKHTGIQYPLGKRAVIVIDNLVIIEPYGKSFGNKHPINFQNGEKYIYQPSIIDESISGICIT